MAWIKCMENTGEVILVNLDRARKIERIREHSRIEFDGGDDVLVTEDLDTIMLRAKGF